MELHKWQWDQIIIRAEWIYTIGILKISNKLIYQGIHKYQEPIQKIPTKSTISSNKLNTIYKSQLISAWC